MTKMAKKGSLVWGGSVLIWLACTSACDEQGEVPEYFSDQVRELGYGMEHRQTLYRDSEAPGHQVMVEVEVVNRTGRAFTFGGAEVQDVFIETKGAGRVYAHQNPGALETLEDGRWCTGERKEVPPDTSVRCWHLFTDPASKFYALAISAPFDFTGGGARQITTKFQVLPGNVFF